MNGTDTEEARRRLERVREKRGYLLPHHGLLAIAAPRLLDGYDAAYTALTLEKRHLPERDKEFIWLAVLAACDEALATHHIPKFRAGGGTDEEIETAIRLTAFAEGARHFAFAANHWSRHLPNYDRERAYRDALDAALLSRGISKGLAEMTLCAVHTSQRRWWELAIHIRGAYREGVEEVSLAEAISYAMFPGSIPNFVDACGVWQDLIARGEVEASPAFRIWGESTDQKGFDQTLHAPRPDDLV